MIQKPKGTYDVYGKYGKEILKEIRAQKKRNPECPYEHIIYENYDYIAEIINNDRRYSDLFDLHSALRLIDRFVNFRDETTDPEVQSRRILNELFRRIQNACKTGTRLEVHENKGRVGPRIILKADENNTDIFGTHDIIIGLSERQARKQYRPVDNSCKEAIITTIFPKE